METTWFIGDMHGQLGKLRGLMNQILKGLHSGDRIVFLGDYIDRGPDSCGCVELLLTLSTKADCVFLSGNHEDMLLRYLQGTLPLELWLRNGGGATLASYGWTGHPRDFAPPGDHGAVLESGRYFYEAEDVVAVHAGIDPAWSGCPSRCPPDRLMWIREEFFDSPTVWPKTVVFGHTPTQIMGAAPGTVWFDHGRHLAGIDTGAAWDGPLTALGWPGLRLLQEW